MRAGKVFFSLRVFLTRSLDMYNLFLQGMFEAWWWFSYNILFLSTISYYFCKYISLCGPSRKLCGRSKKLCSRSKMLCGNSNGRRRPHAMPPAKRGGPCANGGSASATRIVSRMLRGTETAAMLGYSAATNSCGCITASFYSQ
jgi:hypothetical protein